MWHWLTTFNYNWAFWLRVIFKAALLFVVINALFALLTPLEALGRISLYNSALPGRDRLPYGENPAQSYNISLYNLPAMFAAHQVAQPKADDEFRVFFMGDSATWGWLLENDETLTAYLNERQAEASQGQRITAYNLGYPIMSLTKDLLLLDYALRYEPDVIVWLVTLESFPREQQIFPPIVQNNTERTRELIREYDLNLDADDPRFNEPDFIEQTIVGQRRELADLIRLQAYGFSWAATGIDQFIPAEYDLRTADFDEDLSWQDYDEPHPLTTDELAFDVLQAGITMAGDVPVLVVNEPMFISDGENSNLRYNFFYPRWAYDAYHDLIVEIAEERGWHFLDLWDSLPPNEFTDSPVHTTPAGATQLAERLLPEIQRLANDS